METSKILVTGATGFVGARLVAALRERDDVAVRVLVRDAAKLDDSDGLDVVEGDASDDGDLQRALDGVTCAYYLLHSMEAGADDDFADRDRTMAKGFASAADAAGVDRIVYLGGVQPSGDTSEHLNSRLEVEHVLSDAEADVVALRASMVVGAESDSFRTLAQIVEKLPVLALPTWRDRKTQPVHIGDVVQALIAAADVPRATTTSPAPTSCPSRR